MTNKYILFVDTETTGLIVPREPPTHPGQPHLVQLGLILATDAGQEVSSASIIVRPDGYVIPDGAARVHGITTQIAAACGVPLMVATALFTNLRALADEVVAHNYSFDEVVLAAAVHRTGRTPAHPGPSKRSCTMEMAAPIMALPPTDRMRAAGFDKYKPPNLGECVRHFLGEEMTGAHDALNDARACMRVFFAIRRRPEADGA